MDFTLNGEKHSHKGKGTISSLLKEIGAEGSQAAVVVNDDIVPRAKHDSYSLKDMDQIEVLIFAGGG